MNILANHAETGRIDWLSSVYEAVDAVAVADGGVPPSTTNLLHRAIDALKENEAGDHFVSRAEAMAVTIHRLQSAVLDRRPAMVQRSLREELGLLGREWLEATPLFH